MLSQKLGTPVFLSGLRISDILMLQADGLSILDSSGMPVIRAESLFARIDDLNPATRKLRFSKIWLDNASLNLVIGRSDSVMNLSALLNRISGPASQDTGTQGPWSFRCDDLLLSSVDFHYHDNRKDTVHEGIDFAHLDVEGIYLSASGINVSGDSILATVSELSFRERCGFELRNFSGEARVSPSGIRVRQLTVSTGHTDVSMDMEFRMNGFSSFNSFLDSVYILADIGQSEINLYDLGCFAPVLHKMDNMVAFKGRIEGTVSSFTATDFWFLVGEETEFTGNIELSGLPDIYSTRFHLDMVSFYANAGDIERFALPVPAGYLELPALLKKPGTITVRGLLEGIYNDFTADLEIRSLMGDIKVNAALKGPKSLDNVSYSGAISATNLELGEMLEQQDIGLMNLDARFSGQGMAFYDMNLDVEGSIKNLDYKDQLYDEILVDGTISRELFSGRVEVDDDALKLVFDGIASLDITSPRYEFSAQIDRAYLSQMNLSDRGPDMNLRGRLHAKVQGPSMDILSGSIVLDDMVYTENQKIYALKHMDLVRGKDFRGEDFISLNSDFIMAEVSGKFNLIYLMPAIRQVLIGNPEEDSVVFKSFPRQYFTCQILLKEPGPLTRLFMPELDIAPGSYINARVDTEPVSFVMKSYFDQMGYQGIIAQNIRLDGNVTGARIAMGLACEHMLLRSGPDPEDTLLISNLIVNADLGADSIPWSVYWDDTDTADLVKGNIKGYIALREKGRFEAAVSHAVAFIGGKHWSVRPGNRVVAGNGMLSVEDLFIESGNQYIHIDGSLSSRRKDTLSASFKDWSLGNLDPLLPTELKGLGGKLDGDLGISRPDSSITFFVDMGIDSLRFNEAYFGSGFMSTAWDNGSRAMDIAFELYNTGSSGKYKTVDLKGQYYPFSERQNFDLELQAQNLRLSALESFITSFSSQLDGFVTGDLSLKGTVDSPEMKGKFRVQRGEIRIDYLNVVYSFAHDIFIEKDRFVISDMEVYDQKSNKAMCDLTLKHDHFRDMSIDLRVMPDKFMAMDLGRYDNDVFYGQAYATGEVRIYGPFDDLSMDITASTEKGTDVYIPINYYVDVSEGDYIIFRNAIDTTGAIPDYKVYVKGLRLNISVEVTPDANVQISLPSSMGFIKARGNGNIRMGLDPRGYMTLTGTYRIIDGIFHFSFEQLVSRRFEIAEGSSISWNGDVYDADVNIKALYKTKTSLGGLGISLIDPENSSQKVNVNCIIYMRDKLFDPNLKFTFEFPNLNEQARQTIFAVLDTNDAGLMNQQAISILVMNSFSQTGSGSNPISGAAILSSSLSSILSQISNDFDIGVNYIPGDNISDEEIQVALSTQLFNDRLSIDGNFDVSTNNTSSQKTSAIVGDVNVEYKLTRDGRFRVKAFNRANDLTVLESQSPYTQGIGIFYRKDFNRIGELFSRKKRQSLETFPED